MCRVIAEKDAEGRATGRIVRHEGACCNGMWFDLHGGDTVFVCVHPNGDGTQPPELTRTFSVGAWGQIVKHIRLQIQEAKGAGG